MSVENIIWILIIILLLPIIGLIPAYIARRHGRSFNAWWIYGTLLFAVAFPHSLLLSVSFSTKQCPYCHASVSSNSANCGKCGYEFVDLS
ncbi:MAG: zinc ribbon domain-containing protein [Deltaproteobacteria bacterium]|nr:zinc ribbon domain-containing protein [Deltaproteobacteria bacterium]